MYDRRNGETVPIVIVSFNHRQNTKIVKPTKY
jgi:hypothetical protein